MTAELESGGKDGHFWWRSALSVGPEVGQARASPQLDAARRPGTRRWGQKVGGAQRLGVGVCRIRKAFERGMDFTCAPLAAGWREGWLVSKELVPGL